jgi:hypothetical protein
MKRLLFVLAFAFIGQQAFSQMYIVTLSQAYGNNHVACSANSYEPVLSIVAPNGTITYTCLTVTGLGYNSDVIGIINQELNSIINQGYKLIETNDNSLVNDHYLQVGKTWYFAIP